MSGINDTLVEWGVSADSSTAGKECRWSLENL